MGLDSITLTAGMRNNLTALQTISQETTTTQNALSTGKKVNSALDNPTEFFEAQSHTQAASDLSNRLDGMSEGVQVVQAANNGITAITSLIQAAQGVASSALGSTDAATRNSYETQYNSLLTQINTLASDSGYSGTNLLKSSNLTLQFSQDTGISTLTINGFDASTASTGLNITNAQANTTPRLSPMQRPHLPWLPAFLHPPMLKQTPQPHLLPQPSS